jgi:hypothetical protein
MNKIHGQCIGHKSSKLYKVWERMLRRTTNPNHDTYKYYGGRGIKVCDAWKNSVVFMVWASSHGYKEGLELDRKNNNGNYCPENCRFVTKSLNCVNRRKRPDYGIYFESGNYHIRLNRLKRCYRGGKASTLKEARILRNKLVKDLLYLSV